MFNDRYIVSLTGVACTGKTTLLRRLHGQRLIDRGFPENQWAYLFVKFLEYSSLRREIPEFQEKFGNPYLELSYSMLHYIRTFSHVSDLERTCRQDGKRYINLVDRTVFSNLLYDLLFTFDGHKDFGSLYVKISAYDLRAFELLRPEEIVKIRSVDFAFSLIIREIRMAVPNYHIVIVLAKEPSIVAENMILRNNSDSLYNTLEYTISQNFLYKRLSMQLPRDMCTVMYVDRFVDEEQFLECLRRLDRLPRFDSASLSTYIGSSGGTNVGSEPCNVSGCSGFPVSAFSANVVTTSNKYHGGVSGNNNIDGGRSSSNGGGDNGGGSRTVVSGCNVDGCSGVTPMIANSTTITGDVATMVDDSGIGGGDGGNADDGNENNRRSNCTRGTTIIGVRRSEGVCGDDNVGSGNCSVSNGRAKNYYDTSSNYGLSAAIAVAAAVQHVPAMSMEEFPGSGIMTSHPHQYHHHQCPPSLRQPYSHYCQQLSSMASASAVTVVPSSSSISSKMSSPCVSITNGKCIVPPLQTLLQSSLPPPPLVPLLPLPQPSLSSSSLSWSSSIVPSMPASIVSAYSACNGDGGATVSAIPRIASFDSGIVAATGIVPSSCLSPPRSSVSTYSRITTPAIVVTTTASTISTVTSNTVGKCHVLLTTGNTDGSRSNSNDNGINKGSSISGDIGVSVVTVPHIGGPSVTPVYSSSILAATLMAPTTGVSASNSTSAVSRSPMSLLPPSSSSLSSLLLSSSSSSSLLSNSYAVCLTTSMTTSSCVPMTRGANRNSSNIFKSCNNGKNMLSSVVSSSATVAITSTTWSSVTRSSDKVSTASVKTSSVSSAVPLVSPAGGVSLFSITNATTLVESTNGSINSGGNDNNVVVGDGDGDDDDGVNDNSGMYSNGNTVSSDDKNNSTNIKSAVSFSRRLSNGTVSAGVLAKNSFCNFALCDGGGTDDCGNTTCDMTDDTNFASVSQIDDVDNHCAMFGNNDMTTLLSIYNNGNNVSNNTSNTTSNTISNNTSSNNSSNTISEYW